MLKPLSLFGYVALLAVLAGCRSKPEPDLYRPGDTPTWRTVDETAMQRQMAERVEVVLNTSDGQITIELYEDLAPETTANFLEYVEAGFYDGTIFHRVIPGFMIQGGGFTATLDEKPTFEAIPNESDNGLANRRGTVAMARTDDPDSATSQFFINLTDNAFLNASGDTPGYTVFGRVTSGMEVVDGIAQVQTASDGPHDDVPVNPILIMTARQIR